MCSYPEKLSRMKFRNPLRSSLFFSTPSRQHSFSVLRWRSQEREAVTETPHHSGFAECAFSFLVKIRDRGAGEIALAAVQWTWVPFLASMWFTDRWFTAVCNPSFRAHALVCTHLHIDSNTYTELKIMKINLKKVSSCSSSSWGPGSQLSHRHGHLATSIQIYQ